MGLTMHSGALVQSMFVPLLLILLSGVEDSLLQSLRWVFTCFAFAFIFPCLLGEDAVENGRKTERKEGVRGTELRCQGETFREENVVKHLTVGCSLLCYFSAWLCLSAFK